MKKLATTIALALAGTTLALVAPATPATATDLQPAASSYAFQAEPGCLALHTGAGIDGYLVDGLFYDLPTTSRIAGIRFHEWSGLQGDYRVVPLPGYLVTDPVKFIQIMPGDAGCTSGPISDVRPTFPTFPLAPVGPVPATAPEVVLEVPAASAPQPTATPTKAKKPGKAKAGQKNRGKKAKHRGGKHRR